MPVKREHTKSDTESSVDKLATPDTNGGEDEAPKEKKVKTTPTKAKGKPMKSPVCYLSDKDASKLPRVWLTVEWLREFVHRGRAWRMTPSWSLSTPF